MTAPALPSEPWSERSAPSPASPPSPRIDERLFAVHFTIGLFQGAARQR